MPNPEQPSWLLRRIAIFGLLILCAGISIYVVGWGNDNELHRTALAWALGSATIVVMSYAGFAAMQDVKLADILRRK